MRRVRSGDSLPENWRERPMTLLKSLDHWAIETPNAPALDFEGTTTNFRNLRNQVRGIADILRDEWAIFPGDRVCYMGLNHPHMIRLTLACAELGAIFSPLNSRLVETEYAWLLDNAEPKVCFFDDDFRGMVETLVDDAACDFVPLAALDGWESERSFTSEDQSDKPLLLVYTSGTTGHPKGVLLPQSAVWATVENGQRLYNFDPGQNVLMTLPLFHVGGLCILLLPALMHGATIHLHRRFDPAKTIEALNQEGMTTSLLVPAQMSAIMATKAWAEATFPTLKYVVVGSSIIPLQQIKNWHTRSIPVSQVYGATETGPSAIGLKLEDCFGREGSAGVPVSLCEVDVRSADGAPSDVNEPGEIWVRGPNVMSGYWRDEAETAKVLIDGWYNTGDIGRCDSDGFYWIVDRSKDVIISGGENIYPAEVEAVSLEHPAIAAIALVGKPDEKWGETPVAVIELKSGVALSEGEYLAFLQDRLARYKQPKAVVVKESMPRNSMGKIEKSILREEVANS